MAVAVICAQSIGRGGWQGASSALAEICRLSSAHDLHIVADLEVQGELQCVRHGLRVANVNEETLKRSKYVRCTLYTSLTMGYENLRLIVRIIGLE